jgi:hypothetical protein
MFSLLDVRFPFLNRRKSCVMASLFHAFKAGYSFSIDQLLRCPHLAYSRSALMRYDLIPFASYFPADICHYFMWRWPQVA